VRAVGLEGLRAPVSVFSLLPAAGTISRKASLTLTPPQNGPESAVGPLPNLSFPCSATKL
jgi:hypothetical protein